jgi:phosphate starvation-inducible membrane PsiE
MFAIFIQETTWALFRQAFWLVRQSKKYGWACEIIQFKCWLKFLFCFVKYCRILEEDMAILLTFAMG